MKKRSSPAALVLLLLLTTLTGWAQSSVPLVPDRMTFADISVRLDDDARRIVQQDVNALLANRQYWTAKLDRVVLYFPVIEATLAVLSDGGFAGQQLADAYDAYLGWLIGFIGVELAPGPHPDSEWAAQRQRELRAIDASRYPTSAANLKVLRGSFGLRWRNGVAAPMDHAFEASLNAILAGLSFLHSPPRC